MMRRTTATRSRKITRHGCRTTTTTQLFRNRNNNERTNEQHHETTPLSYHFFSWWWWRWCPPLQLCGGVVHQQHHEMRKTASSNKQEEEEAQQQPLRRTPRSSVTDSIGRSRFPHRQRALRHSNTGQKQSVTVRARLLIFPHKKTQFWKQAKLDPLRADRVPRLGALRSAPGGAGRGRAQHVGEPRGRPGTRLPALERRAGPSELCGLRVAAASGLWGCGGSSCAPSRCIADML